MLKVILWFQERLFWSERCSRRRFATEFNIKKFHE